MTSAQFAKKVQASALMWRGFTSIIDLRWLADKWSVMLQQCGTLKS